MWWLMSLPLRVLFMMAAAICVGTMIGVLWLYSVLTSENILEDDYYAIKHSIQAGNRSSPHMG